MIVTWCISGVVSWSRTRGTSSPEFALSPENLPGNLAQNALGCQKSGFPEANVMSRSVVVELDMTGDLKQFRLPKGVNRRLQQLLDKQSRAGKPSATERREAEGLVELAEMLTSLRLRAERAAE